MVLDLCDILVKCKFCHFGFAKKLKGLNFDQAIKHQRWMKVNEA